VDVGLRFASRADVPSRASSIVTRPSEATAKDALAVAETLRLVLSAGWSNLTGVEPGSCPAAPRPSTTAARARRRPPLLRLLDGPEPKRRKQATFLLGAVGSSCIETERAPRARLEAELIRRYRAMPVRVGWTVGRSR
jgi:hypothetical protein